MATVEKRAGKRGTAYRARVELPHDPLTGKRRWKSITAPTKKALEEEVLKVRHQIATGTYIEETNMTAGEYLAHWLDVNRSEVRGSTWLRNECEIRKHLVPGIGHIPLKKLTPLAIQEHYARAANAFAPATIRRSHAMLHKALKQAVLWGLITRNAAEGVVLPKDRHRELQVWDEGQVRTFLAATADGPLAAMWRLAVLVGLRQGELLALQWDDVDFARGTLHVRRTRTVDDRNRPLIGEPKTRAGKRVITLPASCVAALRAHRGTQNVAKMERRNIWQEKNLVFPTGDGDLQWPTTLVYALNAIIKRSGLPKIRFHDLRHTAATLALLQGVSPRVVQERLGHASLAMTLGLYSHVTLTMQEEAADKMDRMFG